MPNQPFGNLFNLPLDADGYCLGVEGTKKGKRVCGAKKSSGAAGPCLKTPMLNHRCDRHGGKTPSGIASPQYEGKGSSRYLPHLPARWKIPFDDALSDPSLIGLRPDIALLDAQIIGVMQRLSTTGAGMTAWQQARGNLRELLLTLQRKPINPDPDSAEFKTESFAIAQAQGQAVVALQSVLEQGNREGALFDELNRLIELKRKLVQTESKRELDAQTYVSLTQVAILYDALTRAVFEHISDKPTLAAIQADWNRLLDQPRQSALRASDTTDSNLVDG